MRRLATAAASLGLALALAGCPGTPATPPAPPNGAPPRPNGAAPVASAAVSPAASGPAVSSAADGSFVPLDAVDELELSPELAGKIAAARVKVPAKLSPEQKSAVEDLESRYQRIEAAALVEEEGDDKPSTGGVRQADAIGRALAGFYWDRLRVFDGTLEADVPDELVKAFATSGRGGGGH